MRCNDMKWISMAYFFKINCVHIVFDIIIKLSEVCNYGAHIHSKHVPLVGFRSQ